MSLLNKKIRFRNKRLSAFHADTLGGSDKRHAKMAPRRKLGTVIALIMGLVTAYTAILYMLPFVSPRQILNISQQNYAADALEKEKRGAMFNPFIWAFEVKKTFLGKGQAIRAHYVIPEGMQVELEIERCARALIVEAYYCKPVGISNVTIPSGVGTRQFKFNQVAFYHFKDTLHNVNGTPVKAEDHGKHFRLIWVRN